MLNNISKLLTGDLLKVLCDMGHSDTIVLADGNFPAEAYAKDTVVGRVIHCPGVGANALLEAILPLFPLDIEYTAEPVVVMDLTDGDKARGIPTPSVWNDFKRTLRGQYGEVEFGKLGRQEFYEAAKKAYVIIQTGEEQQYGNLLLAKGYL
jgi:L-fucose mutarotase